MRFKKDEIEKYKKKLLELKDQLSHQLAETAHEVQETGESEGYLPDPADAGSADFEKIISFGLSSEEKELLKQIDRALEKIEEGTYGVCDRSGNDIPKTRLDAIPYANMTVQAQEEHEKDNG